jgi:hypothetical protein
VEHQVHGSVEVDVVRDVVLTKVKSFVARWAMLSTLPVRRLSIPTTDQPRAMRVSERCEPMNPAAPVMTALGIQALGFRFLGFGL